MSKVLMTLSVGLGSLLAFGCADLVSPHDGFEIPAPDLSLDPDRLTIGEYIATPCAWGGFGDDIADLGAENEWILADVFFGRDLPGGSGTGPRLNEIKLVRSHGGRILHGFNVPAARVRIHMSRIPDLVEEGLWITVRDVPDATRYDLELHVGFNRPLQDADAELIAELGGQITHRFDGINALAVLLPDRSVPHLRARSAVAHVEVTGVYCLQ